MAPPQLPRPRSCPTEGDRKFWGIVLVAAIALRVFFINSLAFTNDEGAYLYDASSLLDGRLPGGDVLVKTPVAVSLIATMAALSNNSLYAGRAAALLSVLTAAPLIYWTAKMLHNRRTAAIASLLWLLSAGSVLFLTLGHTQPFSALFALAALATALYGLRQRPTIWMGLTAGGLLALAFAARKTNLALIIPLAAFWWACPPDWRAAGRTVKISQLLVGCAVGTGLIFSVWFLIVSYFYGPSAMLDSLGTPHASIIVTDLLNYQSIEAWGGGLPWIAKQLGRVAFINTILAFSALVLVIHLSINHRRSLAGRPVLLLIVSVSWLLSLALLYSLWPVLLVDYLADFLPAATLAGGAVLASFVPRRFSLTAIALVILTISIPSYYLAWRKPWTGMFSSGAIKAAASQLNSTVPLDKPVFTAAVIIPYYSGHRVLFDIAHPLWYHFDFIPSNQKQRYLPLPDAIASELEYGRVGAALTEDLTNYAYRLRHTNIELALQKWQPMEVIANDTGFRRNTITLWRFAPQ